jgi:pSer/pThr/pTyr-binding forkhead associated (FHA) protein/S1-C subfamily serine protease
MTQLVLHDLTANRAREFTGVNVRIGRAPTCELVVDGPGKEVVSSVHVRFLKQDAGWVVEDLGSRNGSFLNGERLEAHAVMPIAEGHVVRLGRAGPQFRVDFRAGPAFESTMMEDPEATMMAQDSVPPPPSLSAAPPDSPASEPKPKPKAEPVAPKVPTPKASGRAASPPKVAAPKEPAKPTAPPPAPEPPKKQSTVPTLHVVLLDAKSGEQFDATGGRIRIGRGKECEMRPITDDDTAVSRVHTEIVLKPDKRVIVRDAQSRNGTWVDRKQISGEQPLQVGARIQLGPIGPELMVSKLDVQDPSAEPVAAGVDRKGKPREPRTPAAASPKPKQAQAQAAAPKAPRRSFGGKGATIFFNEMFQESSKKAARRTRLVIWTSVGVLAVAGIALVWYKGQLESRLEQQFAAQQAVADSLRQNSAAELLQLRQALEAAQASSAPRSVVESLRVAVGQAEARTTRLEASVERAQASISQQLAAGDSLRRAAQLELSRVRTELNRAAAAGTPAALLDSLRQAVRAAEDSAAAIAARVNAVRGADLATIAQANQAGVGLVTAWVQGEPYDGSGFAISGSGYFVTNRHVVQPTGRPRADSVFITMADQKVSRRAVIIDLIEAPGPDLSLLRIQNHDGTRVSAVDWTQEGVRQGQPAAVIGFPAGFGNAVDATGAVRTTMTAGIFAKVTRQYINFDGFTIGGSSGSPVFNAEGAVVGIHRAGLAEAAGMGFAVPVANVRRLLPDDAVRELGLR